jgi:hypothetical protein
VHAEYISWVYDSSAINHTRPVPRWLGYRGVVLFASFAFTKDCGRFVALFRCFMPKD